MKLNRILSITLAGLVALSAQSCLKSYVAYFDDSSAERMTSYLSDLEKMLGDEQYGWRMEYFVGNEDYNLGGINVALKFDTEKGEVIAMSEENATEAYKSHYVLTTDSGPVLSFDTHNPILHKYGTASSEYYEGRGGDYQFFIIGYDKENKVVSLKGKRNGNTCTLHPLTESIESYNAKMYDIQRNFYVSTFDGFINGSKVTGDIDIRNRQFIAYEMNEYGKDKDGNPLYDIANTISTPYILTEGGLSFYTPVEVFGETFSGLDFNFNLAQSDTTFHAPANGITFKGHIPSDWLPYEFFEGTYSLTYGSFGSTSTINNIELVPEEPGVNYRAKGLGKQFDVLMEYNIRTGRLELRYQAVLKPGTNDVIIDEDRYIVVLLPWALGPDSGGLWMNSDLGMATEWNGNRENPSFNWVDNGGSRKFNTTSFLLYYYDTDDTADSPYYDSAEKYSFAGSGGSYQLPYLKTFRKTK
ncbi:MAG: DUF4302 domain-containing protein [Bacteroidales bacterium]|nr:DUF4302 domain-containing protein [Bacteroidales bacterium]